jgi:OmcA/MtrC family decaheme c-type cytochrome
MAGVQNRFTLAVQQVDDTTGTPLWQSLILTPVTGTLGTTQQPTSETNGTVTDLGGGAFRYTFATVLPTNFDPKATYRVGVFSRRPQGDAGFDISDATLDFVPAGGAPNSDEVVTTKACDGCHGVLSAHGGFRREVRLCTTCHTTQLFDPDTANRADPSTAGGSNLNPLDLSSLVHRIHRGVDLPTLVNAASAGLVGQKYSVVGFGGAESIFAQTVPSRTGAAKPDITGVVFPQDIRNCTVCHQGAQASRFTTAASRRTCASCHDATWFADPTAVTPLHTAHAGGQWNSDIACSGCHAPTGVEFGLDVQGVHTVPQLSSQANPLDIQIVSVEDQGGGATKAGSNPRVTFKVTNHKDGSVVSDLNTLNRIAATISGPTTDFQAGNVVTQTIADATHKTTLTPNGSGDFVYTFQSSAGGAPSIPPNATGTWAMGFEARRPETIHPPQGAPITCNDSAFHPLR